MVTFKELKKTLPTNTEADNKSASSSLQQNPIVTDDIDYTLKNNTEVADVSLDDKVDKSQGYYPVEKLAVAGMDKLRDLAVKKYEAQLEETNKTYNVDPTRYEALKQNEDYAEKSKATDVNKVEVKDLEESLPSSKVDTLNSYSIMNDDEKAMYNYLANTEGKNSADAYLNSISSEINARYTTEQVKEQTEYADEHGVKASLKTIITSPLKTKGYLKDLDDYFSGKPIDTNRIENLTSNVNSAIREKVAENVTEWGDQYGLGGAANFLYQTGMSTADFLYNAFITGGGAFGGLSETASLLLMSTQAAQDALVEAKNNGLSDDRAVIMGTISGAIEYVTEKMGYDALADLAFKNQKGTFAYIVKNMLSEGVEEGTSDIFNYVADWLYDEMTGEQGSQFKRDVAELVNAGYSEEEATNQVAQQWWKQFALDVAGGALSGGFLATTQTVGGNVIHSIGDPIRGHNITKNLDEEGKDAVLYNLINEGANADIDSNAYETAGKVYQNFAEGKELSNKEVGRLAREVKDDLYASRLGAEDIYDAISEKNFLNDGLVERIANNQNAMNILAKETGTDFSNLVTDSSKRDAVRTALKELASQHNESNSLDQANTQTEEKSSQTGDFENKFLRQVDADIKAKDTIIKETISQIGTEIKNRGENGASAYTNIVGEDVAKIEPFLTFYNSGYAEKAMPTTDSRLTSNEMMEAFRAGYMDRQAQKNETIQRGKSLNKVEQTTAREYKTTKGKILDSKLNSRLDEATRSSLEMVASALGIDIRLTEGQRWNGRYDVENNLIEIDITWNSNPIAVVIAHELTHRMQDISPEKYNAYKNYVLKNYDKVFGKDSLAEALGRAATLESGVSGRMISESAAADEVVADFTMKMFDNLEMFSQFAKQDKATSKSFLDILKELLTGKTTIKELVSIRNFYKEASKLWNEMYEEATSVVEHEKNRNGLKPTSESLYKSLNNEGIKNSLKSMRYDLNEGAMIEALEVANIFNRKEATEFINNVNALMDKIEAKGFLDLNEAYEKGDRPYKPWKQNSDFLYKMSLDYSTLCKKRIVTGLIIDMLNEQMGSSLSSMEQMAIRAKLSDLQAYYKDLQVACAMCYVETARLKAPEQINKFLNHRAEIAKDYFAKKDRKFKNECDRKAKKKYGVPENLAMKKLASWGREHGDTSIKTKVYDETRDLRKNYKPTDSQKAIINRLKNMDNSEFLTSSKLTRLKMRDAVIADIYNSYVRNATKSKALETDVPYYFGDSMGKGAVSNGLIKKLNKVCGLRTQSWSDFVLTHLLDNITAVCEMSTRGAKMHGFTKVLDFVKVNGATGMMINMSLVPEGQTGFDAKGNLIFSSVEGMPMEEVLEGREMFPHTSGSIAIGISHDHIIAMLKDDRIDMIIPYHKSALTEGLARIAGINKWVDFSDAQNSLDISTGNVGDAPEFDTWLDLDLYDLSKPGIEVMRDMANKYKEECAKKGVTPVFEEFANEENYWKLIIGRKMIDQKTGKIIVQEAVKPNFDFKLLGEIVDNAEDPHTEKMVEELSKYISKAIESGEINAIINNKEVERYSNLTKQLLKEDGFESELADTDALLAQTKFSAKDTEYLELAKDPEKNESKLRKMLDEAAKAAGYIYRAYHGTTSAGFNEFATPILKTLSKDNASGEWVESEEKRPIMFTTSKVDADSYAGNPDGKVYDPSEDRSYKARLVKFQDVLDHPTKYSKEDVIRAIDEFDENNGIRDAFANGETKQSIIQAIKDDLAENGEDSSNYGIQDIVFESTSKYGTETTLYEGNRTYDAYIKVENPIEYNGNQTAINSPYNQFYSLVKDLVNSDEYDGLVAKNCKCGRYQKNGDIIVVKDSSQVKLANLVLKDDNGNIIPLSERFNSSNPDIRYSAKDSEGRELSEGQIEYFKDSKVRDSEGKLLTVYHGTKDDFTVFHPTNRSQENVGFSWATPDWSYADGFAGGVDALIYGDDKGTVLEGYLNITNLLDIGKIEVSPEKATYRIAEIAKLVKLNEKTLIAMADTEHPMVYEITGSRPFMERVVELGYDGVKAIENGNVTTYGFVHSNQFKNVDNLNPTTNDDIRYSAKGNGYDGYSMSNNARTAYSNGEMPISKWNKSNILDAISEINSNIDCSKINLQTLKDKFLKNVGWHHTSDRYNVTDFYAIDTDYIAKLTQEDVNQIADNQKVSTKATRDTSLDAQIDDKYAKALAIVEAGLNKTERGALNKPNFDDAYSKAVEIIKERDKSKVDQWRKLPADHYRHKQVELYDNDIDAYIKEMYANKELSKHSTLFKELQGKFSKTTNKFSAKDIKGDSFNITGNRATYTDERIDAILKDSDYGSGKTDSYIAYINPIDFIKLTTSKPSTWLNAKPGDILSGEKYFELDREALAKNPQMPFLYITMGRGGAKVTSHEGRHRMLAMLAEGIDRVPVRLIDRENRYEEGKVTIDSLTLRGQDFNGTYGKGRATLSNVIPATKENKALIKETFGGESKLKFSAKDTEYLELAKDPKKNLDALHDMVITEAKKAGYQYEGYHGTDRFGFTVFDPTYSDDGISLFFAKSPEIASTYAGMLPTWRLMKSVSEYKDFSYDKGKKYSEQELLDVHNFIQRYYHTYGDTKVNVERQTITHAGQRYSARWLFEFAQGLSNEGIYSTAIKINNPFTVDAKGANWEQISPNGFAEEYDAWFKRQTPTDQKKYGWAGEGLENFAKEQGLILEGDVFATTRGIVRFAKEKGYDGVLINNVYDLGAKNRFVENRIPTDLIIAFDSTQVKSADPVTYDDNGKIIPLSERFKESNPDIRYSAKDKEYLELAKNPSKNEVKLRTMLDERAKEKGFPLRLKHGTNKFGFTVIDPAMGDDGISFFATDSEETASTYSGVEGTRELSNKTPKIEDVPTQIVADFLEDELNEAVYIVESGFRPDWEIYHEPAIYVLKNIIAYMHWGEEFLHSSFEELEPLFEFQWNESVGYSDIDELDKYVDEFVDMLSAAKDDSVSQLKLPYIKDLQKNIKTFLQIPEEGTYYYPGDRKSIYTNERIQEEFGVDFNMTVGNYDLYAKAEDFLEIDAKGRNWNNIPFNAPEALYYSNLAREEHNFKRFEYKGERYEFPFLIGKVIEEEFSKQHPHAKVELNDDDSFTVVWHEDGKKYSENVPFKSYENPYKGATLRFHEYKDKILKDYGFDITASHKTRDIGGFAYEWGYRGVHFKNLIDHGGKKDVRISPSDVYIFFYPEEDVKSADLVTYREDGSIIPLSERFNSSNDDIRYSAKGEYKEGYVSLDELEKICSTSYYGNEKRLVTQVFNTARKLGISAKFVDGDYGSIVGNYNIAAGTVSIPLTTMNGSFYNDGVNRNEVILHEMIHGCTIYAIDMYKKGGEGRNALTKDMQKSIATLEEVYDVLKDDPNFKDEYGITDIYEMVAEIGTGKFNRKLKQKSLWGKVTDAILRFFGIKKETDANAYEITRKALVKILNNANEELYREHRYSAWDSNFDLKYSAKDTQLNRAIGEQTIEQASQVEELQKISKELETEKKKNAKLSRELRLTEQALPREAQVGAIIREYRNRVDSVAKIEPLKNKLYDITVKMMNGEADYSEIHSGIYEIAKEILENSLVKNENNTADALYRLIKGTKIKLDETSKKELKNIDTKLRFYNEGRAIDSFWAEISEMYPDYTSSYEGDVLTNLTSLYESLEEMRKPIPQFSGAELNEYAEVLAGEMLEDVISDKVKQMPPTYADKMTKELEKTKYKNKEALATLRKRTDEKLKELRDKNRKTREEYVNKGNKKHLLEQIEKRTKSLSDKLLAPTDKKHIPQDLQKAVAEVLSLINKESTFDLNGKQRVAKGEGEATKRTKIFNNLRAEYEKLFGGDLDTELASDFVKDYDFSAMIDELVLWKDTPIRAMSIDQLNTVYNIVRSLEALIYNENRVFGNNKRAEISEWAEAFLEWSGTRNERRNFNKKDFLGGMGAWLDETININSLTPQAFFHRFGVAGDELFKMLRKAQDRQTTLINIATEFTQEALKDVDIKKLDSTVHKIKLDSGKTVELTTSQIMYFYKLLGREQARRHIVLGGIKPTETQTKGVWASERARAYSLTGDDQMRILAVLTDEEKAIANKLQKYWANGDLSKAANEASLEVYNYEKFTDPNYVRILVDQNTLKTSEAVQNATATVAGKGMAKSINPHASNPVLLRSIFDIHSTYVSDMTTYAAWLGAIENARRVMNFKFENGDTMRNVIQYVTGVKGNGYWQDLLGDINRGRQVNENTSGLDALSRNYKAAAIGGNIRVILQQPTAIVRAMAEMDGKYLSEGVAKKGNWELVKKYAPIAVWKDWGNFDINTGRQMRDVILGTDSKLEDIKQKLMTPAGMMDSWAWSKLWNAVELETQDLHPEYKQGTEEYYNYVAERFADIIDKTQVVDGVLQRSGFMRSKNAVTKMASSFMGETTKVLNMLLNASYDYKTDKDKNKLLATGSAVLLSFVANSIAQAIVDAIRDDDKDQDYLEKLLEAFFENFVDAINPLNYVVFIKDIWSMWQGYDVSRMDTEAIAKVIKSVQGILSTSKTTASKIIELIGSLGYLFGVPTYNIKRDLQGFLETTLQATGSYYLDYQVQKFLYNINSTSARTKMYDILYEAYKNDRTAYSKIRKDMIKNGIKDELIQNAIKSRQKKEEK